MGLLVEICHAASSHSLLYYYYSLCLWIKKAKVAMIITLVLGQGQGAQPI